MYTYNHRSCTPVSQGYATNAAYGNVPGHAGTSVPPPSRAPAPALPAPSRTPIPALPGHATPSPVPGPMQTTLPIPASVPPAPALRPVQVPLGTYPIELVQFLHAEHGRGRSQPLHWALFVRTAPLPPTGTRSRGRGRGHGAHPTQPTHRVPQGNFYELVGTSETYTAQFLSAVSFSPESLPDWRGTHVLGWVRPTHLGVFERAVRQVPVWRRRPEWRSQQWAYEVVCALVGAEGVYVEAGTYEAVQRQMGWLLEAWESGDI